MPIKGILGGAGVKPLGYGLGAAEEATDPNFNETILLLHADGSEGEGNTSNLGDPNYKAFRDNSTSAHNIAVEGGAYGNDFSPYYYADGYWSRYSQALSSSDSHGTGITLGTNNFTIGMFVYPLGCNNVIGQALNSGGNSRTTLYADTGATSVILAHNQLLVDAGTTWTITINFTTAIALNQWQWIQVDRTGSTFRVSINGSYVDGGGATSSGTIPAINTGTFGVRAGQDNYFGYYNNFILINGANRGSIATPTSPLTADSDTALLLHQSNRLVNNGNTSVTLTSGGDNKISTNTPFTQSKTANVGSGYFDGTGDYLNIPTSTDLDFGTGDFTLEFWIYPNEALGFHIFLSAPQNTSTQLGYDTGNGPRYLYFYNGANVITGTGAGSLVKDVWNHVALVREGTTVSLFSNGNRVGTATHNSNVSFSNLDIGRYHAGGYDMNSYMSDIRAVKGSAVYDPSGTTYTIPTTTLASTGSETKLLTCQYSGAVRNVGFVDDSKYNNLIVADGGASLGTFSPFSLEDGYWSVYFDGVDDELNLTNTATIGTGNFTMEMWVYPQNNSNSCLIDSRSANGATDGIIFKLNGGKFQISGLNGTTDIPLNEWTHLAVVREGTGTNETKMYVNGALEKTISFSLNLSSTFFGVGVFNDGGNSGPYKGYISNLRVVNDTVYTDTFTVPSTPLTAISNTDVLICQSNKFVDNSTNGFAITLPQGTAKIKPFSPFAPSRSYTKDAVGGSAFFDSGKIAFDPRAFDTIRDGDFTIEFWWYPVGGLTGYPGLFSMGIGGGYGNIINIGVTSNNALTGSLVSGYSADFTTPNNSYLDFQWHHIVLTRSGSGSNNCAFYINGVRTNQFTDTGDIGTGATVAYLGSQWFSSTRYAKGFYSSFRATNNAVYDITSATLTVPSAPLSNTANTLALTKFDNAGIIDHTMKNILLGVGDTRITTTDKKIGTGSLVFDGTDYLQAVNTEPRELFTPNGGDMTWEMFVKFDILDGLHTLFSKYGSGSEYQFYYDNGNTDWRLVYHTSTYTWDDNSIVTGTWYHIALVKDGTTHYLFKNGTSLGTNTATENTTLTGRNFALGTTFNGPNSALYQLKGKLDEIRVTRVARYTSTFTAPTKSYPNK